MSLAQRFERRLESLVGSAFARVFKGQVEPVEIGTALQREAADKRHVMSADEGVMCPNRYRVTLSPSDYERLVPWESQLTVSLSELIQDHLDENGWTTIGDVEVVLALDDTLHTGVFGVSSRMEASAPPRSRPHDSLSMPVINDPGAAGIAAPPQVYQQPVAPAASPPGPPATYEPAAYEPAAYQPAAYQPAGYQPGAYPPGGYGPPAGAYGSPPAGGYGGPGPPGSGYQGGPVGAEPAPRGYGPAAVALVVDGTNDRLELRVGANLVGRGTEADLQLLDNGVSRKHAEVDFDGVHAICFDLGSTNGTTVNGHDLGQQAVTLQHGDVIRVGHTRLVFTQDGR